MSSDADRSGSLGSRLKRREDARLLTGEARYVADITIPGMLHTCFVRSTVPHARLVGINTSTSGASGVTVLTASDLPHRPLVAPTTVEGLVPTPQPALAGERVRYVGEPVAMVLAASRSEAEDAVQLVQVDYQELPAVFDPEEAVTATDAVLLESSDHASNVIYSGRRSHGDVPGRFAEAACVVTGRFRSHRVSACPMEPRGCIAVPQPAEGRLTMYSSTQSPHLLRRKLAACLSMAEARIRVLVPEVGGGFGVKIPCSPEEVAVALAARALRRPVSWIEERSEHLVGAPHAKDQVIDAELALALDGSFLALRAKILGDAGAYSYNSASALIEPYLAAGLMPGPYRVPAVECDIMAVLTNTSPVAPYRGVGWTAGHSAREMLIERASWRLGRDPADVRRQNLVSPGQFPYESPTGMTYDSGSFVESLDLALELVGYESVRERQCARVGIAEPRSSPSGQAVEPDHFLPDGGERLLGVGVSPYVEPSGWGSAGAAQSGWSFSSHDSVRVTIEPSGEVTVAVGTPSQGQGHETTLAQVIASELGVEVADVTVLAKDTAATPLSIAGTRASRAAVVTGGALTRASEILKARLQRLAGALFECDPEDVVVADGAAHVRGVPLRRATIAELAEAAYFDPSIRGAMPEPDLVATCFYDPQATYSNGCIVAVVEVDPTTFAVQVTDAAVVEDCGRMINPTVVEGQMLGAFAQGVGMALLEQVRYGDHGQVLSGSLLDYGLPTMTDVPAVRLGHRESPSPFTEKGIKGMGESGLIAAPAAIALAVSDALRPYRAVPCQTPITPDYLAQLVGRHQEP